MFGLVVVISFIIVVISCIIIQVYCKQLEKAYHLKIDDVDLDTITSLILFISFVFGLPIILMCMNIKSLIEYWYISIITVIIEIIIEYVVIHKVVCKDWGIISKRQKYINKLEEIENKLEEIKYMKRDIREDEIFDKDKGTYLANLEKTEETLKRAYREITVGLHSLELIDTIKGVNELALTDETKEELQKQIDVYNAYAELSNNVVK